MENFSKNPSSFVAGWIAENYLAISRCMAHIFSYVRKLLGDEKPGTDYYDMMIQSLQYIIARLMAPISTRKQKLNNYIKRFLHNHLNHFWNKIHGKNCPIFRGNTDKLTRRLTKVFRKKLIHEHHFK